MSFDEEVESYCCKFYSEEDKNTAINRFSITEAELHSKEHIKNVYTCNYTYLNMYRKLPSQQAAGYQLPSP